MAKNDMRDRLSELRKIAPFAARDHRLNQDENGNNRLIDSLPRAARRKAEAEARRIAKRYSDKIVEMRGSGAGFPVDRLIRELATEYTNRYASSGIHNQPMSFNYFEPFCTIRLLSGAAPYAEPAQELDHLFSISDFFDYATSPASEGFHLSSLLDLPEGKIFHFTTNGDVRDLTFLTSEGREFVISGFSMIRHGVSLHWYAMGGAVYSDEEWERLSESRRAPFEPVNVPPWKAKFITEVAERHGNEVGPPLPLEGTERVHRIAISGETDLVTEKHLGRCYMAERQNSFEVICDDPEMFDHFADVRKRQIYETMLRDQVEKTAALWTLGETLFQLPAYFAYKLHIKRDVIVSAGKRATTARGGQGIGGRFKTVAALDVQETDEPPVRSIAPTHYQVETSGHWRRLKEGEVGRDQHGAEIVGRTWVKKESSWREIGEPPSTIFVKSTLASAKIQIAELLELSSTAASRTASKAATGVIYVLRCVLMSEEVYKVGWTSSSADDRAKEISAATGVAKAFAVVDYWPHNEPEALEKNIHAMLDPYRLNDRREFFQAKYSVIKGIIENEIQRVAPQV